MDFTSTKQTNPIDVGKVQMNCDQCLSDDLHPVLVNRSHIACFVGKSASGKTNLMTTLMSKGKSNGVRPSYKKVFNDIIIVSPSLASSRDNIFDDLDETKKFTEFDADTLEFIRDFTEENTAEDRTTLVILDDVAASLKAQDQQLTLLTQKFRHLRTTWFFIAQKYTTLPTSIRANMSVLYLFRPISMKEREAVHVELLPFAKTDLNRFFEWVFDRKYNFLYIDLSLQKSAAPIYHKNFDLITFSQKGSN